VNRERLHLSQNTTIIIKKGFLYISFVVNNKIGCKKINLAVRTKILILAGT